ncbi:hypothetical protein R3P38DRAFT_3182445 [Favolaschia claudopus]|uniref:Uncharacterized protein n=1 Tax=Favolaschia claudopus TaxID=2862362 RepID=A0AAW0CFM3_9AGAR
MRSLTAAILEAVKAHIILSPNALLSAQVNVDFKLKYVDGDLMAVEAHTISEQHVPIDFTVFGQVTAVIEKGRSTEILLERPQFTTAHPVARLIRIMYDQQLFSLANAMYTECEGGDRLGIGPDVIAVQCREPPAAVEEGTFLICTGTLKITELDNSPLPYPYYEFDVMHLDPEMTWVLVHFMRNYINTRRPAWKRTQSAWLFPDGESIGRRLWVHVPVIRGRNRAHKATHTEAHLWIDAGRGLMEGTVNGDRSSIRVDNFPFEGPTMRLKNSFTIVVADQSSVRPVAYPANQLIATLVPELAVPWTGNVLVFKHGKTAEKAIINIAEEDGALVELIIRQ